MIFSEPHSATWIQVVRGDYNVTSEVETVFSCMIEEEAQFFTEHGQPVEAGKGIIFTTASLAFRDGDRMKIGDDTFLLRRVTKLGADGEFHHFELVYG